MIKQRLALGLDLSTQGISAVVLDVDARAKIYEHSLDYCRDGRLNIYGVRQEDYILPPEAEGEASQPAEMFFAALDAIFSDLKSAINIGDIAAVNSSGQQHGHVYLNDRAYALFRALTKVESVKYTLPELLKGALAYDRAPIWMTADTEEPAEDIRRLAGGKKRVIELSGSDVPLRFTGAVMRKIARRHPEIYMRTENIQLISSLPAAVLAGVSGMHLDYGNCCGTSLMDYRDKKWSDVLIKAASDGLPGGEAEFKKKLPSYIWKPHGIVGIPAEYFVKKYGFSRKCQIVAGSGDNPQSKALVSGDLISLGSSIVNMVSTDGNTFDFTGYANAMYDGLGRPFMFGCRTNGALVWDRLRAMYGLNKYIYQPAEDALRQAKIGQYLVFWQPRNESFPVSGVLDITRMGEVEPGLGTDYPGVVESTLAAVYYHSRGFTRAAQEPLYVTGGAQNSPEVLRRVAAMWRRPVIAIEEGGAALGAAAVAAGAFMRAFGEAASAEEYVKGFLKEKGPVIPGAEDMAAFHRPGGYLDRFAVEEARLLKLGG